VVRHRPRTGGTWLVTTASRLTADLCLPESIALRRVAAKQGYGCRPRVEVRFRLKGEPALGMFGFASEDWSFLELVTAMRATLSSRAGNRPIRHGSVCGELAYAAEWQGACLYPSGD
jgi:hypothetical protein